MNVDMGCSDGDVVRRALGGLSPPLVVDLGRRHVAVAEQFLHLADVLTVFEEQGGGRGARRVR